MKDFIEFLRHNGYQLGEDKLFDAQNLANSMEEEDSVESVKRRLASIIANRPELAEDFSYLFDIYFEKYAVQPDSTIKNQNEEGENAVDADTSLKILSRRRFYWTIQVMILIGISFLGINIINCYLKTPSINNTYDRLKGTFYCITGLDDGQIAMNPPLLDSARRDIPPTDPELDQLDAETVARIPINPAQIVPENISDLEAKWYHKYGMLFKVLIIVLIATAFSFYELFRFHRKKLIIAREKESNNTQGWKIPVQKAIFKFYTEEAFYEASEKLRARKEIEEVNEEGRLASISEGEPTEYLLLIEKHSNNDHRAMLYDQLALEFSRQNIYINRYFFERDPRLCWTEKYVDDVYLDDLHKKHPNNRLVIIGDISAYFSPLSTDLAEWTKLLKKWEHVAILDAQNPLCWGKREAVISKQFTLLPASVSAVGKLVEIFEKGEQPALRYWLHQNRYPLPPSEDDPQLVEALKKYFDTRYEGTKEIYEEGSGTILFNWICALAIYPELYWNLSILMGERFSTEENKIVTPQNLLKLFQLQWFHEGDIPDSIREKLIEAMDKEQEMKARKLIVEILEANPPPTGSAIAAEYSLNLAVQKAHINQSLTNRIKLIRQAQDYSLNYELRDQTLVKELNELPESMLHIKLPMTLKWVIFNQGMISMGFRPWIRAAVTATLLVLIALNITPSSLDRVENFAGNDYFLNSKEDHMRFHTYVGNSYLLDSNNFRIARQNYERALQYKRASGESYLTPDYNLAVLNLEEGRPVEAIKQFEVVQEIGDSLLTVARTNPQNDTSENLVMTQAKLKEIVARSNLNQGIIALRGGDQEGAETKIKQAEELLEAKYSLILFQLTKPANTVRAQNYIPLKEALQNIRDIYAIDPDFFQKEDTLSSHINRVLDSLTGVYQNTTANVYIEEIRAAMRGDTIVTLPPLPPPVKGPFTKIGDPSAEGLTLIKYPSGEFGFVQENNGEVIASGFDFAQAFSQGRAAVKQNARWGYLNKAGNLVISSIYKDARDFVKTTYNFVYATVKKGGKWGAIDLDGNMVIPFEYDIPIVFSQTDSLAVVAKNGKYGYIDIDGNIKISIKFDEAARFIDGRARVTGRNFKYNSIINTEGQYIVNPPKPEKWIAIEERVIHEHRASINDVSFSPSGNLLLTGGQDATAKLWRDKGKVLLRSFEGHTDWVRSVSFIPNKNIDDAAQKILTSSKDGTAIIWNRDGTSLRVLEGARGPLWHAAFSSNGKYAATASEDRVVRIYDVENENSRPLELNGHRGTVNYVEFSTTGDSLVSASEDGKVKIWSKAPNWTQIAEFDAGAGVLAAHFSPDGRFIAAATKGNVARVWSIATKALRIFRSHTDWVTDAVFSPNSQYVLTTSYDKTAKVFNLEGIPILNITKHRSAVKSAAFSPDSKYILTASWDRTVRLWAIEPW